MSRHSWLLSFVLAAAVYAAGPQDTFDGVQRIVAIGDVHGQYDKFIGLLQTARLVDAKNVWIGGRTHLVLTGDFLDRGPASRKVMDLLMALEPQAEAAGGRVHALIGNHEAMNIYGDLRYVSASDFESYRSPKAEALRDRAFENSVGDMRSKSSLDVDALTLRKKFDSEHPLGWVEQRIAFAQSGKYGKWLLRQNAVIRINNVLFLHGGISPKYATVPIKKINETVRNELSDFSKLENGMTTDTDGPLWYRALVQTAETDDTLRTHINRVLETQQVRHIVIGHTPEVAVLPRFGGAVVTIDVGLAMSDGAPPAFVVIEGGKFYAVHRGRQLDLPVAGEPVLPYLRTAAELDPPDTGLRRLVSRQQRQ